MHYEMGYNSRGRYVAYAIGDNGDRRMKKSYPSPKSAADFIADALRKGHAVKLDKLEPDDRQDLEKRVRVIRWI